MLAQDWSVCQFTCGGGRDKIWTQDIDSSDFRFWVVTIGFLAAVRPQQSTEASVTTDVLSAGTQSSQHCASCYVMLPSNPTEKPLTLRKWLHPESKTLGLPSRHLGKRPSREADGPRVRPVSLMHRVSGFRYVAYGLYYQYLIPVTIIEVVVLFRISLGPLGRPTFCNNRIDYADGHHIAVLAVINMPFSCKTPACCGSILFCSWRQVLRQQRQAGDTS